MARPADFQLIDLTEEHEARGREAAGFSEHPFAWVGLAAEQALKDSLNQRGSVAATEPGTLDFDLLLDGKVRVEIKTRVASAGWTDPGRFKWIGIPTHDGREPIKDTAQLAVFCWWSADAPRDLWVIGRLLGVAEFRQRATFYGEDEPTPRGGVAPKGGMYVLEIADLRPWPRDILKLKGTADA